MPLSLEGFITSFVVLIGRYDEEDSVVSDELFFQALSILPDLQKKQEAVEEPSKKQVPLDELDFNEYLNQLDPQTSTKQTQDDEGVLKHDLIEIVTLLLWLGTENKVSTSELKTIATNITANMSSSETVSWHEFCDWKQHFAPHLFDPLKSFILKTFGYYKDQKDGSRRMLLQASVPTPDTSHILTPLYTTLISWALPEQYTHVKSWSRLYSSDEDGFSMNRFEVHVFKYPGPTLTLFQLEDDRILGAFVTEPWKQSRNSFWGSNNCFLFELDPLTVYRSVGKNDHYIYYHHDFGMGFGGTSSHSIKEEDFVLRIDNTLQQGVYTNQSYPSLPTFESFHRGKKAFRLDVEINCVEVFGLGTERDKQRQEAEWRFDKKEAQRRAGLNIRQTDGALDKDLLKMAGIIDMDNRQDR